MASLKEVEVFHLLINKLFKTRLTENIKQKMKSDKNFL